MKKVFILMIKKFYVQNGIDLPMAIDNEDVKVFENYEDAEFYRSDLFEKAKGYAGDRFAREEIHNKRGGWNFLAIHFKNKTRFVYEITESDLISSL